MAKRISTILLECMMFIGLVTMLSHLSTSIWERYLIQNELTNVKSSLYLLKNKVSYIGQAYDSLHLELSDLALITDLEKPRVKDFEVEIPEKKSFANTEVQAKCAVESNFASAHILVSEKYKTATKQEKDQIFEKEIAKRENYKNISIGTLPQVADKFTQNPKNRQTNTCRSQSTLTTYPPKSIGVFADNPPKNHGSNSYKSESTITRYPPRNIGIMCE